MSDIAEDNAAAGAYVITSSQFTSNSSTKVIYQNSGATHLYNFQGNIDGAVWNIYGFVNDLGYKVVIDRDGFIRHKGSDIFLAESILLECLGVS